MVDIHSATAEIRRGKKEQRRRRNHRTKICLRMAAIISILPCIQWRNRRVFTKVPWSFDDKLVHISDTVKSKLTMWTFRHTALLTRVHSKSTPSPNTPELCSRLNSETRHPTTASKGIMPPATGPADKSSRPTANSMGRRLVISHPSSRGCCCCKVNVFRFGVFPLSKSGSKR